MPVVLNRFRGVDVGGIGVRKVMKRAASVFVGCCVLSSVIHIGIRSIAVKRLRHVPHHRIPVRVQRRESVGHQVNLRPVVAERHRDVRVAGHLRRLRDPVHPVGLIDLLLGADLVRLEHRVHVPHRGGHQAEQRVDEVLVFSPLVRTILLVEVGVGALVLSVHLHHRTHVVEHLLLVPLIELLATLAVTARVNVLHQLRYTHQTDQQVAVLRRNHCHRHHVPQRRCQSGVADLLADLLGRRMIDDREAAAVEVARGIVEVLQNPNLLLVEDVSRLDEANHVLTQVVPLPLPLVVDEKLSRFRHLALAA